jgi:hypothetical protein
MNHTETVQVPPLLLLTNPEQLLNDERSTANYECGLSKESHTQWNLQIQHHAGSIWMNENGRSSDQATRYNYSVFARNTPYFKSL